MVYQLYSHQEALLKEVYQRLYEGMRSIMVVSPAGSGKSVLIATIIKQLTDKKDHILFMVHRKELIDQIQQSLIENEVDLTYVTILSVIKTKNRLSELPKPTLIITDETHHAKAKTYMEIYDYFADVSRIGFTATPVRLSGEGFEDVYECLVEGQSVSWLIDNHYLAPFEYYSLPMIDRKKLKTRSGEFTNQSISRALQGQTIYGKVIETYLAKANGQQAILYAHSVEYSEYFTNAFNNAGIKAVHVDASTPKSERERIMKGFKEKEFQVICNVDLISEGFNVPDCSTVILLRPTQSLTLFVQQSMRGMRYRPQKKAIIIDHVGNYLKHGLPDTQRLWTLSGIDKEQEEAKLHECPNCFSVFENWLIEESNQSTIYICPNCGNRLIIPKKGRKTEGGREKDFDEKEQLTEITEEERALIELKKIAKFNHVRYKNSLYAIAKIFVARNQVADLEKRKRPYNYPIYFAIREYLKYKSNANYWIRFTGRQTYRLLTEINQIVEEFGKEYQLKELSIRKYMNKVSSEYKIHRIFDIEGK